METIIIMSGLIGIAVIEGSSTGAFTAAAGVSAALWLAALWQMKKGNKPGAKEFAVKAAAYILTMALLYGLNTINNRVGRQGAERLAAACEAYKTQNGKYPESLEQLVPQQISHLPLAKISFKWSRYWLKDNRVLFASEPGLVVDFYNLAAKERGHYGMHKLLEKK